MSSPVVGIDLGTTNTVVASVRDGQAAALRNDQGEALIPSVVSFHPSGSVLVGPEAKNRRKIDAKNTIYSVKRLIGRSWDTEEVRVARQRFPFEMREGPGQSALVVARKETYTLPEISAFVLRKAKSLAEAALGTTVERAVITVPANFNDLQRAATKVAGRVAGLEVMRILNEPTAAALAYGYGKISSERIAVYDFGGGTLDITLLDLSDNVFEVLATAGNTFLGGDDIDHAICDRMADALLATHRVDARADAGTFELLRWAAEDIKKQLTVDTRGTISIAEIAHQAGGKAIDFGFSMQRRELEQLIAPIVARTFDVCREALGIARLEPRDFSQVLLVGGSTRIPLVRAEVERFFGLTPITTQNPDEVVALGAAIQANALSGAEKRRSLLPAPPNPAARARMPSHPAIRVRQSSLAPSAEGAAPPETAAQVDTSSYGRPRLPTERGLQPTSPGAVAARPHVAPFVAPTTSGQPSSGVPVTADRSGSRKRTTAIGLGAPPALVAHVAEPARTAQPAGAEAGAGSAETRRAPPGATLRSVAEQAAAARRATVSRAPDPPVEPPFALDFDDEPTQVLPSSPPADWEGDTLDESEIEELSRDLSDADDSEEVTHARGQPVPATAPPPSAPLQALISAATAAPISAPVTPRTVTAPLPVASPKTATLPLPAAAALSVTAPLAAAAPRIASSPFAAAPENPRIVTAPLPATPSAAATWGSPIIPLPPDVFDLPTPGIPDEEPTLRREPPSSRPGRTPEASAAFARPEPPLLIDVTPLTLAVETVGGYCDTVITRNSPIPCENSRQFATVMDNQDSVRVRVSQGEAPVFSQNTLLGEVLLSGLRAAPRGQVKIEVAFALDPSGMLNVNATDVDTGRSVSTRIRLVGLTEANEVESMRARHAALQYR